MGFDITSRTEAETADMVVTDPVTGEETDWVITFAGPGHPKAIEQKNRIMRKSLKRQRAKGADAELTPDEIEAEGVDFIIERIIDWRGAVSGGEDFPFTEENARVVFTKPDLSWLRAAANRFLADEASFISRSAKT